MRRLVSTCMLAFLLAAGFACFAGCRGQGWMPIGRSLPEQQSNAVVHDPFPLEDVAPTDNGVRPPAYREPLSEPVRNRLFPDAMPWLGR